MSSTGNQRLCPGLALAGSSLGNPFLGSSLLYVEFASVLIRVLGSYKTRINLRALSNRSSHPHTMSVSKASSIFGTQKAASQHNLSRDPI